MEEFLFLQKIEGENPSGFLESQRQTIIEQDAQILVALCLLGYLKPGFEDFDDKVFDGQNLYLIDTDEIVDLYSQHGMAPSDFKELLLNPTDVKALDEFRETQRFIFGKTLKDVLFRFRKTLVPTPEDQALYIASFFRKIGWPKPTEAQIRELTTFPENYLTLEQHIGMIMEE
ncbi:MAG TPA: hypothetical protein VMX76_03990 [Nevskiaceae bacterium]|nr:hypothetical protein [Nevskiaceae bacterium]